MIPGKDISDMPSSETDPSESSPLLQNGVTEGPESGYSSTTLKPDSEALLSSASPKPPDNEDIERQNSSIQGSHEDRDEEGRQEQYEGIPEIRRFMKYILPALGIGVC